MKSLIIALLLILLPVTLPACSAPAQDIPAGWGEKVSLAPGQTADIADGQLLIRFVEIVSDSRCPIGVQCIWAGEVSAKITIENQGQQQEMVLTSSGSSEGQAAFLHYQFIFEVQPYPEYGKEIKSSEYQLIIKADQMAD